MTRPAETGVTARGGPPRRGGGGASGGGSSLDGAAETPAPASLYASLATQRLLSRLILLLIAALWFGLLAAGCATYEGHPPSVKPRDLPLHWFDVAFRRYGALLLLALWAARAATTLLLAPGAMGALRARVWAPCALYAGQAALRSLLYALHYAGWLFPPSRMDLARGAGGHPPHVMSDHILLAATLVAGAACEALLPLLAWRHDRGSGRLSALAAAHSAAAVLLAALLSLESYATARYFHPPAEIIYAAGLGLVVFQAPAVAYARSALAAAQAEAVAAASRRAARPRASPSC